jgi:integration host factor subunit alpha
VNKRQLVATAARRTPLTQLQTREALEAILAVIACTLVDGDHVVISGFGRFDVQQYAGRNLYRFDGPGHYKVEERRVPVFRSSKLLRQRLRRKDL